MRARIACAAAALTLVGLIPAAAAADVKIGSSGDYVSGVEKHMYGKLTGVPITDALFVNIETTVDWSRVASGSQDAALRRWANALKGKGLRLVSWSHEPMAKQNVHWGTAASFVASFKHVVSVFDAAGATNVEWVWNVTSHSFRVQQSSSEYGAKWYPGDAYVDDVAGEAYNRYQCGTDNKAFGERVRQILAFARQHGKPLVVAEFAANRWSGRAQWLRDAKSFIAANRSAFRGAFYYNSPNGGSCDWKLSSSEQDILRSFQGL